MQSNRKRRKGLVLTLKTATIVRAMTIPEGQFSGYIFDCDGTLTDNMPLHYKAWMLAMKKYGGQFPEELFYRWGGTPTLVIIEQLNKMFNLTLDPAEVGHAKEVYYTDLIAEVEPFVPVVEIVQSLQGKAKLAVASGGYRRLVVATLKALNILDCFEVIVTVEDTVRHKPDPDPFLLAARKLGVEPAECLVFEDSPTGIKAAEAAGMKHVLVPTAQMALDRIAAKVAKTV